jgi:hypothetical protein
MYCVMRNCVNLKKYVFYMDKIMFLGYVVIT